jgi:polysaccharide export outer membrane protein
MKRALMILVAASLLAAVASAQSKTASATTDKPKAAGDGATYIIGPTDVMSITVWKEPALSATLPVRPDGMISMPLLNDVQAAGFTPMKLAETIALKLKQFIQDPQVSIVMTEVNSQRVYLLGEVAKPGPVTLSSGLTVLQVISSAGGLSPFANSKKIYVLRNEAGGVQRKIAFNYKQAVKGDINQNLFLQAGDTIVVP